MSHPALLTWAIAFAEEIELAIRFSRCLAAHALCASMQEIVTQEVGHMELIGRRNNGIGVMDEEWFNKLDNSRDNSIRYIRPGNNRTHNLGIL